MGGYYLESPLSLHYSHFVLCMSKRSFLLGNEFLMYWAYPFSIYMDSFRTSLSGAVYAWRKGALIVRVLAPEYSDEKQRN